MWNRSKLSNCRSNGHVLSQRRQQQRHLWRRERGHLVQFTIFRVVQAGQRRRPLRVSAQELLQELQGRQLITTTYSVSEYKTLKYHFLMPNNDIKPLIVNKLKSAFSLSTPLSRYECGGQKKFRCLMCGKAFSQSTHLKRHLESGVCIKYYHWASSVD